MFVKGIIRDNIGEACGSYWSDFATGTICFRWLNLRFNGYTEEGFENWLDRLGLNAEENCAVK